MRDEALEDIRRRGAELVAVGSGTELMAADFVAQHHVDFPVLVDPGRHAYQALALKHGALSTFSPRSLAHAARALKKGFRQGRVLGDPNQQGGAFVIVPPGEMVYAFASGEAGDHPPPGDLVAALDAAGFGPGGAGE